MKRIKDKATGLYFVKINEGCNTIGEDGKSYKTSTWNEKGRIFQDERSLNLAMLKLTTIKDSKLRGGLVYPTYSVKDLEIEPIS